MEWEAETKAAAGLHDHNNAIIIIYYTNWLFII